MPCVGTRFGDLLLESLAQRACFRLTGKQDRHETGRAGAGAGEGGIADRIPAAISGAGIGAGAGGLLGTAGQVVGKPLGVVADHVNAWRNPQALADRVVARNVARDAADLPAIAQRMEDAAATNPASPLTLADAAGHDTRGLAGVFARTPGEGRTKARQFLEDRHVGSETEFSQGERIIDRIGRVLGDRGSIAAADDIIAKRAAQSKPAYEAAFKRRIEYPSPAGRELRNLIDRIPCRIPGMSASPRRSSKVSRQRRLPQRPVTPGIGALHHACQQMQTSAPVLRSYSVLPPIKRYSLWKQSPRT